MRGVIVAVGALALAIGAALLAAVVVLFGPHETVSCIDASWPDSLVGDSLGHVDGADTTGCVVPTTFTWLVAATLLVALPTGAALALSRRVRAVRR